jgi:hypothetical protein
MQRAARLLILAFFWTPLAPAASAPADAPITSITDATAGMTRHPGFMTLYSNSAKGLIFLEISGTDGQDLLYQPILASGLGRADLTSDSVILDRGYLGPGLLVTFRRFGDRVLLIQRNTSYFTPSSAYGGVRDSGFSFPDAVVAAFPIQAEEGDRVSKFFRRDGIGISAALRSSGQGNYTLDDERSAVDFSTATASDRSIEVDSLLTFVTHDPTPERTY